MVEENDAQTNRRPWSGWRVAGWVVGVAMLVVALVAKQFIGEVDLVDTLAQTGFLLIGVGIAVDLASRMAGKEAYRTAIGLALASALLLGWMNSAVGIIGSENNAANLMYEGVIGLGVIGALIVRFTAEGMARVLVATALGQTVATVGVLVTQLGSPHSSPYEIWTINGSFIALFIGSAVLFQKAARHNLSQVAA